MSNGIYEAITNAMAEIQPIAKEKRNQQQGFQYRGIDDVMNELNPILTRHKIFIYPEVINSQRAERQTGKGGTLIYSILTIKYHFATNDGSEICATVVGEGMDSGDKASNKALAVAFKYACLQMFCIPTDEITDPDATTPPESRPKSENYSTPKNLTNSPQNKAPQSEKLAIIEETRAITRSLNPDELPYFTEEEKAAEKAIAQKGDLQTLKEQRDRLKKEFDKRVSNFKPLPFEDSTPDMYKEPEFENDIPYEQEKNQIEIF